MAIYLLDFENVHDSGISGVTTLTENDELCIFYSVKSEHMSFETHVNIMKTAAKVKYIKLRRAAKNYLDFQLCTHLGYIIGAGFEGPFYIISKDTGYDSAIDYWKDHGVTIIRQPSIGFNRSLGKSTGQNPTHNTPPALVTFKQGNVITNPDVQSLYKLDTVSAPKDAQETLPEEAVLAETAETPAEEVFFEEVILPAETDSSEEVSIPAEIDAPAETIASAEPAAPAPEKSSSGSTGKKKKSRSSKASEKSAEDAVSDAPAAADITEQKESEGENGSSAEEAPANTASTRSSRQSKSRRSSSKKADETKEDASASQDIVTPEPETVPQPETAAAEPAAAEETAEPVPEKAETLPESFRKRVRTALKGRNIPSAYYASIYKAILNSYDKLALNNLLVKTFGSSKGGEVYKQIKEIFMDFQS